MRRGRALRRPTGPHCESWVSWILRGGDAGGQSSIRRRFLPATPEYEVPEERVPRGALLRARVLEGLDRLVQGAERRRGGGGRVGRSLPPVVHQHVEALERLDVVPPQWRDVDRVARPQLGNLRCGKRLAEAREAFEVGLAERHQADGRAGRREVERSYI